MLGSYEIRTDLALEKDKRRGTDQLAVSWSCAEGCLGRGKSADLIPVVWNSCGQNFEQAKKK